MSGRRRDHRGIAELSMSSTDLAERRAQDRARAHPVFFDPARKICRTCGRAAHWVRRTYGPHGRAGFAQHTGDGLAQFASWHS
jgi:hypothetical protein